MKISHWTVANNSGMSNFARSLALAEVGLGLDPTIHNPQDPATWVSAEASDIHVVHTHFPDAMRKRVKQPLKLVWVAHGTPEHVFQTSVETGLHSGYGASDSWMLLQYWLQHADAVVTFWPRHKEIYQSLCDKGREITLIPLGVDKTVWKPVASRGKFAGNPSVFTAENPHYIKWPLDLLIAWPWVCREVPEAKLHLAYMVRDQLRWFSPLANRNGAGFSSYISEIRLEPEDLRNAFCSVDYFIGLVRYGDFNQLSLQAAACGAKTISYRGNPYADYWVSEGDQRTIAQELQSIFTLKNTFRDALPVPSIRETAIAFGDLYEKIVA
jgi:hypothetical protein